jgi:hypothetical protein
VLGHTFKKSRGQKLPIVKPNTKKCTGKTQSSRHTPCAGTPHTECAVYDGYEPCFARKNPAELPAEQAEQRGRNREEAVVKMNGTGAERDVKKKNEKNSVS